MENISLSVIVPVYNMEKYLGTCIESLLAQTYEDLQIVLVNDCSTDNSLDILKNYESKYPKKIVVIDSKENLRQGGARNLGMKLTQSEYIGFVDADDFIHPRMYEILMKEARENGSDVIYCMHENVDETATGKMDDVDDSYSSDSMTRMVFQKLSDEERMDMMLSSKYGCVWGGVYRRDLIERNALYFPEHLAYEDNYWVCVLQMLFESVTVVQRKLYYYRQQNSSTIHKKNAKHHYDRIEISKRLLKYVKDNKMMQRYHDFIEYFFIGVSTLNSCSMFVSHFDEPRADSLDYVKDMLKKEFPHWRKNRFYKKEFPIRRKMHINLLMLFPSKWYIRLRKAYMAVRHL